MEINIIKLLILLSLKKKKILPFATWINPEDTAAAHASPGLSSECDCFSFLP